MDNRWIEASQTGNIDVLYELIGEDPDVLRRIDEKMFVDTPLHIAASSGNTCFAMELLNLMPSFAKKLNKSGLSPMHLALMAGNFRLVLLFLRANPDLVRVKGRGGLTPLHYATKYGKIDLMTYFLAACPESIEDVTVQGETVLHIAVKSNMVEALQVLVGWIRRVCHKDGFYWQDTLPNWKDEQANSALDIAISVNQVEAIRLLDQLNARKSKSLRALQFMPTAEPRGRKQRLFRLFVTLTRWSRHKSNGTILLAAYLRQRTTFEERLAVLIERYKAKMSDHARSALLVVAGIILAATLQPALPSANVNSPSNRDDNLSTLGNTTIVTISSRSSNSGMALASMVASIPILFLNSIVFSCAITVIGILLPYSFIGHRLIRLLFVISISYYYVSSLVTSKLLIASFVSYFYLFFYVVSALFTGLCNKFLWMYWRGMRKIKLLNQDINNCPREAIFSAEFQGGSEVSHQLD